MIPLSDYKIESAISLLDRYCVIFKMLVLMTKSDQSKARLTLALRISKPFVDSFITKLEWMKKHFISHGSSWLHG
jgi:hypothetical protein